MANPIEPDTKDWTWVLREQCPECGLAADAIAIEGVPALIRDSLPRWRTALMHDGAAHRADPATWSTLEYGCHVRDVFRIFDERLALMLAQDSPTFANWDQDATALEDDYGSQDCAVVAEELSAAGLALAARFEAVTEGEHARRGLRSNGSEFTVTTLGQYFWHDVYHHLHDVGA